MSQQIVDAPLPLKSIPAGDSAMPTRRAQVLVLAAAFLGWMFDGLEMGIFPQIAKPALTDLLARNHLDKAALDAAIKHWNVIIDALFLFGAAFGGLVFGWLGDKIGRVKAMSTSILVYSGFTGLLYFVRSPGQIAGMRFVAAIGMGGEWALGVALVMEVWDEKYRPFLAGLIGAASNVGFTAVGIMAWLHPVTDASWRWVVLAGAAPAVITFFIQFFVPESHKWKESQKIAPSRPLSELFGTPELSRRAVLAIAFASIALLGTWGAVQKIPSWISIGEVKNASVNARPFTQILCGLGAIVGCLIAPYLAAIFSRRIAYFLLCLGSFISCEWLFGGFTNYGPALLVMVFIVGCLSAAFYGWLPLYLPELFPTRVRATAQGISYNFGRILAAVGSIGLASMSGGYGRMGMIVSAVYVLGMIAIWFAPETKGKALPK